MVMFQRPNEWSSHHLANNELNNKKYWISQANLVWLGTKNGIMQPVRQIPPLPTPTYR